MHLIFVKQQWHLVTFFLLYLLYRKFQLRISFHLDPFLRVYGLIIHSVIVIKHLFVLGEQ